VFLSPFGESAHEYRGSAPWLKIFAIWPDRFKHFEVIMKDLHQTDELRVLDYDGHRVFRNFMLSKPGQPVYQEP
jgi:hypothetical protein